MIISLELYDELKMQSESGWHYEDCDCCACVPDEEIEREIAESRRELTLHPAR